MCNNEHCKQSEVCTCDPCECITGEKIVDGKVVDAEQQCDCE